mmetsp:Transcript_68678/g.191438  ORF Transcript_68678/g.191438 Transcript_68678/m.191438 type:complete len:254 (+) Transcript_68678:3068-3829(+)
MHHGGCTEFMGIQCIAKLVDAEAEEEEQAAGGGGRGAAAAEERAALTSAEFESLTRFALEAAIPQNAKVHCPECERMCLLDDGNMPDEVMVCPHCEFFWNPGVATGEDGATKAFLDATSKACPNCSIRTTHYHGHACHHIGSGSNGCPGCGQHWCYVCERTHGTPQGDGTPTAYTRMADSRHPDCPHGSSFCRQEGIADHITTDGTGYPHDSRCGCPICPLCRPGQPCAQCTEGGCVVCLGLVPPGPSEITGQ